MKPDTLKEGDYVAFEFGMSVCKAKIVAIKQGRILMRVKHFGLLICDEESLFGLRRAMKIPAEESLLQKIRRIIFT